MELADEFAAQSAQRGFVGIAGCASSTVVGHRAGRVLHGVERPPAAGVGKALVTRPAQQHAAEVRNRPL